MFEINTLKIEMPVNHFTQPGNGPFLSSLLHCEQ